jgi:hypothetical protein
VKLLGIVYKDHPVLEKNLEGRVDGWWAKGSTKVLLLGSAQCLGKIL